MLKWLVVFLFIVCLQWDPNTETDIAGYKIYRNGVAYTPSVIHPTTNVCVSGEQPGQNDYNATAYNTVGYESDFSNTVSIPLPYTPVGFSGSLVDNMFGDIKVALPVVVNGSLTIY